MKVLLLSLLALGVASAPAFAQADPQQGPGPGGFGAPSPQMSAAMQQSRAQLESVRRQSRARMIAALTPAHRTLFANVVAQLALSAEPNPRAAAATLDAALAPAEQRAIVNIAQSAHASARAIMQQTRAAFEANLDATQRAEMTKHHAELEAFGQSHAQDQSTPDAGSELLRTLGNVGRDGDAGWPHHG